jgi:hypothetical protein
MLVLQTLKSNTRLGVGSRGYSPASQAEVRVCETCGGQSGTATAFSPSSPVKP